ncbi:RhbF-like rhizobactin siderophore biosynthesis protein [Actinoplanes bogorensis]|uniref:RhbF-like rhizobactin siderophore biosynthesis protein n=1 Tax=Paractinoplanes bogorensis TaxID=1610840 RepID=A0ABS5YQ29_9ACTN|nr:IucA/IucC family protein [Actinoplanes bogorensis]MBU2665559.1 RhbF-like rhizobactin siderophore biosynthesis protein [Actinoplanes bogorensis]
MNKTLRPERIAHTEAALAVHAPELVPGFLAALPEAADTVGRRLRGALVREGIKDMGPGVRHGFGRVEYPSAGVDDPVDLLDGIDAPGFAAEIRNAVMNLAIAMARPHPKAGDDPDEQAIALERLAVAGHNLHPCGRTRLGWDTGDVLAHDLEAESTRLGFVAVRSDLLIGDDVFPELEAPAGFTVQPVHAWQRDNVLPERYREMMAAGLLKILDAELTAIPTAALRTLLLPGTGQYLKVSLDIQVTSTRRSISIASTRNGPAVSRLLHELVDDDRILLMAETAGAAMPLGSGRDLSAIRRDGLAGRLEPDERAVPGGALPFLLDELVTGDPGAWLRAYGEMVIPPLMRLTAQGVALEAHLQNCLPTFVGGRPHRLALRDFAGLRLHQPRLAAAGHHIDLWPGSVVAADTLDVFRAKIGYTLFQAHLGELVLRLGDHGLDEDEGWRILRAVVDEHVTGDDHAAFTAPMVPHKALVRMRLAGSGDIYVPVRNPLHAPA